MVAWEARAWRLGGRGLVSSVMDGTGEGLVTLGGVAGADEGEDGRERLNLGHCSSRKAKRGSKEEEGGGGVVEVVRGVSVV